MLGRILGDDLVWKTARSHPRPMNTTAPSQAVSTPVLVNRRC
jgi:hypothetical protein